MNNIYRDASKQLGMDEKTIRGVYCSYWLFIKNKLSDIDIDSINNEDEFKKLRTSFSISFFGKFYIDWKIVKHIKRNKNGNKKNKTTILNGCNNNE